MKRLLASLVGCGMGFVASAIPLYEPFDYDNSSNTNLIGRVNNRDSIQWYQAGPDAGLTNQPYVDTGSLEYPGHPPPRGNKARFGGNGTSARYSLKDIDAAITGTIYYSFLFRINDTSTLNDTGVFWAGFNNTQGAQTTTPTVVLARFLTKNDVTNNIPGNFLVGISKTSGTAGQFTFATNSFSTNDVVFVVGAYTWIGDTADGLDYARLWVNPDPSTFGAATAPEATVTNFAGSDSGNVRSFVLWNRNAQEPRDVTLDDLLIGNNWADVTPRTNDMLAIPPKSQTVLAGNHVYFDTRSQLADSIQWQFNGTNLPGATGTSLIITNAQPANAGTYSVVYSNLAGVVVSNFTLTVLTQNTYPSLTPLWSLAPGDRPYLSVQNTTWDQRSLAYSAVSNQVLIVSMTNTATGASTGQVYVLDGTTGTDLYQLNTDVSVINSLATNTGNRPILSIDVGADGAVFAGNLTDNGNARGFQLYRWADSGPATTPVRILGPQEPASSPTQHRWGDTLAVRGSGTGAEVVLDDDTGMYGAVINYDSGFASWISTGFFQTKPRPSLARSLQFGSGNFIWQKSVTVQYGGAGPLESWDYDLNLSISSLDTSLDVLSSDVGPVAVDLSQNLLAGISFTPVPGLPDTLALYDISNPASPVLLARYPFPVAHQSNSAYGKVVIKGNRVYAINANNGVLAFEISPPRPALNLTRSGANFLLAWPTNFTGFTLQATPSLTPPVNWTNVGSGSIVGGDYVVTNGAGGGALFYRLQK
jgi:hypothetical protein